jgi:putative transposase
MSGDRCGRQHPFRPSHRGSFQAREYARCSRYLRSDYGPEFVSRAVLRWLTEANIETAHIDPGKPWQNGSNESFNGKFRDECLSMHWFKNRIDAKILIEQFRRAYSEIGLTRVSGSSRRYSSSRAYQQQPWKPYLRSNGWSEEGPQVTPASVLKD